MTKQYYFSTLFKRVSVSSLIGIVIMLLVVACPAPSGGGGGSIGAVPTPPTLMKVDDNGVNGGLNIKFKESDDMSARFTLITAKSRGGDGHTVTARVPRSVDSVSVNEVTLYGLKDDTEYDITVQAVSKDGVKSTVNNKESLTGSVSYDEAKKLKREENFLNVGDSGSTPQEIYEETQEKLKFLPQVDASTSNESIKIKLSNIPELAGIDEVELLAVDARVDVTDQEKITAASKRVAVSTAKKVKLPKSKQEVLLKGLKVAPVGTPEVGKVNIFYRLSDVNKIVSHWISTGDPVKPIQFQDKIKFVGNTPVTVGSQSITSIAWKPVSGYKTQVLITNVDLGIEVTSFEVNAGKSKLTLKDNDLKNWEGKLFGESTYRITLKALKDGIYSEGVSKEVTVKDTSGPEPVFLSGARTTKITLSLTLVKGKFLQVAIDKQPFAVDYAKTEIKILRDGNPHKDITLKRGTLSHRFEIDEPGKYTASAIFYDVIGNPSDLKAGEKYTLVSAVKDITKIDNAPTTAEIEIDTDNTVTKVERSDRSDEVVFVRWELKNKSKSDQVDQWDVAVLQRQTEKEAQFFVDLYNGKRSGAGAGAGAGAVGKLLAKLPAGAGAVLKKLKGADFEKGLIDKEEKLSSDTRSVRFSGLKMGWYVFTVLGTDIFGNKTQYALKAELTERVPSDLTDQVTLVVPANTKGTLKLNIASVPANHNTTHIKLTLKKGGQVVKGYKDKKYKYTVADYELKPLEKGDYTAELRAYSKDLLKYSKETKKISTILKVESGLVAPTEKFPGIEADPKKTSFDVPADTWPLLSDNSKKADVFGKGHAGEALEDAKFEFFYAKKGDHDGTVIGDTPTAVQIAEVVDKPSDSKKAGKISIPNKASLHDISVKNVEKGQSYFYFIRTIHSLDDTQRLDGEVQEVKLLSPPAPASSVDATGGDGNITVNVTAHTEAEDFGNAKTSGNALNDGTVEYIFYYAKKGATIGGSTVDGDVSAADLVTMIIGIGAATSKEYGKKILTSATGLGSDVAIAPLIPGEYYYVVRVQETAASDNGSNTVKKSVVVTSAAAAVDSVPTPTFAGGADAASQTNKGFRTEDIVSAVITSAKNSDGTSAEAADILYTLYYASSPDKGGFTDAASLKKTAEDNNGSDTAGVMQATVGSQVIVAGKNFKGKVYVAVEAIIKSDPSKSKLSGIASYGSLAKAGTGDKASITATPVNVGTANIEIDLNIPDGFDYGTDKGGNKLSRAKEKWLFYMQTAAENDVVKEVVKIDNEVKDALEVADHANGTIRLTGKGPWTVKGLSDDTEYRFAVRFIHKESSRKNPSQAISSGDHTEFARDTEGVSVRTKFTIAPATGGRPRITVADTGAKGDGEVKITLEQLVNDEQGSAKEKFGTKADGPASEADIEYWVYYAKEDDGQDTAKKIMDAVNDASIGTIGDHLASTTVSPASELNLSARKEFGAFKIAPKKGEAYKVTGLEDATDYKFFVRQVRIDGTGYDASKSKAGTLGKDSLVVSVTTKSAPSPSP